jgi:predicted PhzF superfamily epimerase YddE/YHI9
MPTTLVVVDAFTDTPFAGNPAAVCVLDRPATEGWMQQVADEMHLSETAFVVPRPDGDHDLRWFTPTTEVNLCGHATLATASVLGGGRFHTRSGVLACTVLPDGWVEMDLPSDPPVASPTPDGLLDTLGLEDGQVTEVLAGREDLAVVVAEAGIVRRLAPEFGRLAGVDCRGVLVTAAGDTDGVDCVSRFFAPRAGIDEDPVTGSAHCTLAPYWAARTGRTELTGVQASRRGGTVRMRLAGDRVVVGGQACRVSEVSLRVDPI